MTKKQGYDLRPCTNRTLKRGVDIRRVSFDDRPLTTCNPVFAKLHGGRDRPGCEKWVGLAAKNITTVQSCKSTFFPGVDLSRRSGRHNKSRRASFQISCAVHLMWWSRKCPSFCRAVSRSQFPLPRHFSPQSGRLRRTTVSHHLPRRHHPL